MPAKFGLPFVALGLIHAASAGKCDLVIDKTTVDVPGKPAKAFTINGQFPAPTLRFKEGEHVTAPAAIRFWL